MSTEKTLTSRQRQAIIALLSNTTQEKAAAAVGVNPQTISRWKREPRFRSALFRAQGDAIDEALRPLVLLAKPAIVALADVLKNPAQRGASQKRLAARDILDHLDRLRDREIEVRITLLEEAIYGKHQ